MTDDCCGWYQLGMEQQRLVIRKFSVLCIVNKSCCSGGSYTVEITHAVCWNHVKLQMSVHVRILPLEIITWFWKLKYSVLQGVVTYMSRAEALQPFSGADQRIKVASGLLKSTDQKCAAAIWPLTMKNQAIKSLRRERSSNQVQYLLIKHFDHGHKCFNRQHMSDYPLYWV